MMRRLRSVSLLVAFCLINSAAAAYAECAWVLWREAASGQWQPTQGFASSKDCEAAQILAIKQYAFRHSCLPDTVDPRGAKEAGR
jgi:hypothetical protein